MGIRTNILLRVYLAFGLILLFAGAVVFQLCRVQFVEGPKWKAMAKTMSAQYVNIEAERGNIFASDGSLLATSVPEYELHMDMLAGGIIGCGARSKAIREEPSPTIVSSEANSALIGAEP